MPKIIKTNPEAIKKAQQKESARYCIDKGVCPSCAAEDTLSLIRDKDGYFCFFGCSKCKLLYPLRRLK